MRIAIVIAKYDALGGGAERWTDRHARMLLDRGHEVHLIASRVSNAPDAAVCHIVPARGSSSGRRLRFAEDVESILRENQFDVVHDMGDGWYADILMPHHGTRAMGFRRNTEMAPPALRWARRLAYRVIPRYLEFQKLERRQYTGGGVQLFEAVSPMIARHMRTLYDVPDERIRIIFNGVDPQTFRPADDPEKRNGTRRSLGLKGETIFLIVAHNFRLKGLDTLIHAMSRLRSDTAGSEEELPKLLVVGGGDVAKYEAKAKQLGCADAVQFLGDQPNPVPYFQAADVFVLPTHYDPCSLVAMEAMSCGLPTITSKRNGVHELMTEGREGFVIDDPADAEALAACMRKSLDAGWRAEASMAARALAVEHSITHSFDRHLAVYAEVAAIKATEQAPGDAELRFACADARSASAG